MPTTGPVRTCILSACALPQDISAYITNAWNDIRPIYRTSVKITLLKINPVEPVNDVLELEAHNRRTHINVQAREYIRVTIVHRDYANKWIIKFACRDSEREFKLGRIITRGEDMEGLPAEPSYTTTQRALRDTSNFMVQIGAQCYSLSVRSRVTAVTEQS